MHKQGKDVELRCCLYLPHEEYKHLSPGLLLTMGGTHIPVPGWSPWIDEVAIERCPNCGRSSGAHQKWCEPDLWDADGEAIL